LAEALNEMTGEIKRLQEEIAASERLSTFARVAAGLAHDLQAPIEALRVACEGITLRPDDDAAHELFTLSANEYLPKLHRYVRDLRRLAHDGNVPLELSSIDAAAIAEKVIAEVKTSPKWRGVEFVAEGSAVAVWGDASLLRRAIFNLAANGADAVVMTKKPGKVTIRVGDDEHDSLIVDVIDTGVGIPADQMAEIMVHDFKSTKRNSGVGLGLGVARHVATSHGGEITVSSQEGKGSTFRMRIPRLAHAVPATTKRGGLPNDAKNDATNRTAGTGLD
jgi:two-component system sensor histidine kinase SenX3